MAFYEKWHSERYIIGCDVWEARCPNCHELVESADPISSNYRFCPYCGFDMKSDFQRVADRRQFTECSMKLKKAKRLLKAAVEDFTAIAEVRAAATPILCPKYYETYMKAIDVRTRKWQYADEALALIGEDGAENE